MKDEKDKHTNEYCVMTKKNTNLRVVILLVTCAVLVIVATMAGLKAKEYSEAVESANRGYYQKAYKMFIELGDYKDSKTQLYATLKPYAIELARD